jgi:hypothetical protein
MHSSIETIPNCTAQESHPKIDDPKKLTARQPTTNLPELKTPRRRKVRAKRKSRSNKISTPDRKMSKAPSFTCPYCNETVRNQRCWNHLQKHMDDLIEDKWFCGAIRTTLNKSNEHVHLVMGDMSHDLCLDCGIACKDKVWFEKHTTNNPTHYKEHLKKAQEIQDLINEKKAKTTSNGGAGADTSSADSEELVKLRKRIADLEKKNEKLENENVKLKAFRDTSLDSETALINVIYKVSPELSDAVHTLYANTIQPIFIDHYRHDKYDLDTANEMIEEIDMEESFPYKISK